MKKITETGSMLDTDPSLYTGFEVDPVTGKAVKKGEDDEMNDKDLHSPEGVPDDTKHPNINVQAEAYKPGFVIRLEVDEAVHWRGGHSPEIRISKAFDKASYLADRHHDAAQDATSASQAKQLRSKADQVSRVSSKAMRKLDTLVHGGEVPQPDGKEAKYSHSPYAYSLKKEESPLTVLKAFQQIVQEDETIKMVWEDKTTGQKGDVTPALFVKVYSKMLVAEQAKEARAQSGSEQKPMSESKPNMALANELLALGLVNNVKETAKVLREENPMRKAMEIFYASKNSNADKDEVKYVPSVIKEGKAVLDKKSAPVVESKPEEKPAPAVKKRLIYW